MNHYFKKPDIFSRPALELAEKAARGTLTAAEFDDLNSLHDYRDRDTFVRHASWHVPTVEWLDAMAKELEGARVLEVAAGRGLLGPLMRARGLRWICTDAEPPEPLHDWHPCRPVEMDAVAAAATLDHDVIFWGWWPYGGPDDDCQVAEMTLTGGKRLYVVGEDSGGCNGSDRWTEDFTCPYRMECLSYIRTPSWYGIHDNTWRVHLRD